MKARLPQTATKRLEEHRKRISGPVDAAQKALWDALMQGDVVEVMRQVDNLRSLRGPQPWTPEKQRLLDRLNQLAAERAVSARDVN